MGFHYRSRKNYFHCKYHHLVLSYFGPKQKPDQFVATNVHLDHSYLAKMGKGIEPVIAPLGYDWKMGVGILTSFVAREVFVGTMSTYTVLKMMLRK
jgi:Fe2+ transport system protein B